MKDWLIPAVVFLALLGLVWSLYFQTLLLPIERVIMHAQVISAIGILAAAVFSALGVRGMRKQTSEQWEMWERRAVRSIKPVFSPKWFQGESGECDYLMNAGMG